MWGCPWCGYGYGIGGWVFGLLWFLLIAWAIYALFRAVSPPPRGPERDGTDRALSILRERYARGEIDKETFERMKRDLGG